MKICVVSLNIAAYFDPNPRAKYGGAEVQAAFLSHAIASAGMDVKLVVSDQPPGVAMPFETFNAYRSSDGLPGLRFFHPRTSGILHALEQANADIYYQRNAGMITGLAAWFCKRNHRTFIYGAGSDTDLSLGSARVDGWRDRLLFYYGLKSARGVVVQNDVQRQRCAGIVHVPTQVIPNGVLPVVGDMRDRGDAVFWAGGLRKIKRPDLFVELARRMPERRFVMVGGATSTERDYARGIEESARDVPNLTLTGWKPHSDVLMLLRTASILVNTSTVEGFPNVYLEAWNHGVPVVSFNDVDNLIADEQLGVICRDIDEMETQLRALLLDNTRLAAMRTRARAIVSERFSPAVLGPKYVTFFERVLKEQSARRA